MLKISQLSLALCASIILVACGGGSSTGGTPVTPPTVLATAAYAGNWKDACNVGGSDFSNNSNVYLNEQSFTTITPLSDTTISVVDTVKSFPPADTSCSGAAVITQTKAPILITLAGTVTIGGQVVDKVTFPGEAATVSLVSGSISITGSSLNANTVSINGYSVPGAYLTGDTTPIKMLLRVAGSNLYCSDSSTKSPITGYPTAMEQVACFTKI